MSLQSHIQNLRSKPEHIRRRAAFWYSFGITAVIFLFWLASFTPVGENARGVVAHTVGQAGSPAQSLVASVGSFFGDIRDLVLGPKKITYSTVEVAPGPR